MQVGQRAGGLQALRNSIEEAVGKKQTDHRIVELSLAGAEPQKLALESPTAKPSGWSHLVGSLRSLAGEDPMTQLTSAITREYGAFVGAEIAQTLRGRVLTVGLASQALRKANHLFTLLQGAPGMSETRALAIVRFATFSQDPKVAATIVWDHAQEPDARHQACTANGPFVQGASIPQDFPKGLSARGASTPDQWEAGAKHGAGDGKGELEGKGAPTQSTAPLLHKGIADRLQDMRSEKEVVSLEGMTPFEVSSASLVDLSRTNITICGVRAARDTHAVLRLLRSKLPEGPKGDELALMITACFTQAVAGQVKVSLHTQGLQHTPENNSLDKLKAWDVWQSPDGAWNIQHTMFSGDLRNRAADDPGPRLAELTTSRLTIDPGKTAETSPRIVKIATDASYTIVP